MRPPPPPPCCRTLSQDSFDNIIIVHMTPSFKGILRYLFLLNHDIKHNQLLPLSYSVSPICFWEREREWNLLDDLLQERITGQYLHCMASSFSAHSQLSMSQGGHKSAFSCHPVVTYDTFSLGKQRQAAFMTTLAERRKGRLWILRAAIKWNEEKRKSAETDFRKMSVFILRSGFTRASALLHNHRVEPQPSGLSFLLFT